MKKTAFMRRILAAVLAFSFITVLPASAEEIPEDAFPPEATVPETTAVTTEPAETTPTTLPAQTEPTVPEETETVFSSPYKLCFGLLHAHTDLSDGLGSVEEAFAHAARVEGLDFFRRD